MEELIDRKSSIDIDNKEDESIEMGNESIWLHLIGKPSIKDTECDIKQQSENPETHIPMTTRREIWAWYLFDVARTPLILVMLALVFPVYLSIIATRYGCKYNTPNGCDYYDEPILASSSTLIVYIGDWSLKPESFALIMISLSGGFQAIGYLWISSIADYSNYQIYLFRFCTIIGDIMAIIFIFIPDQYWLFIGMYGSLLLVPMGLSWIFYNAFLPILVKNHWLIRRLQRQYKNNEDNMEYESKYKHLLQSIQDEISQFGYAISYIGSFIAAALAGIGFFFLEDISTEIIDYNINNTHNIDNYYQEYWMKPVNGIDIWFIDINVSNISTSQIISSQSYINGIQLSYGDIFVNGSIVGVTEFNDTQFIFEYDADSINIDSNFIHSHYVIDDNVNIIQINLYKNNDDIINGIHFITNNITLNEYNPIYGGNINIDENTEIISIIPDKYPNYELSGYMVENVIYCNNNNNNNNTDYNITLPIIYGYSFSFMDIEKGQYGSTLDNRLIFGLCGVWSLIFATPAFIILKSRKKEKTLPKSKGICRFICPSVCTVGFYDYYMIIKDAKNYPNLFKCLIAWFIWSDAENTTGAIGILFGQNELGMNSIQLLLFLLELQLLAFLGNFFFIYFQKKLNLTNKNLLILHLLINTLLPIWAIFGLFEWSPIGLLNIWEMYVIAGLFYASQLGSLMSSSRSLYGHLIPEGKESQFFGLYEFTNKGSSWIGPLLATIISNNYNLRYAIIYILIFYVISIPILQFGVNYEQGMIDAGKIKTSIKKPLLTDKNKQSDLGVIDDGNSQTSVISGFNVESNLYGSTHDKT